MEGRGWGRYYAVNCDGHAVWNTYDMRYWVSSTELVVSPEQLARIAADYFKLQPPRIATNPPVDRNQLVQVATWLWVDESTWRSYWATASVPNETATAVATPVRVTWAMGDGSKVTCRGPGTPYDPTRPPTAQRTDCAYTYRQSSAGHPNEQFTVTATITWRITWTASGVVNRSGTLPDMHQSSSARLRVVEAQAVN